MAESPINKHGLKRYIPSPIRRTIREEAGCGCVICGCVLVDYEHIEPEWHDAYEHDPAKMTLLCPDCHSRVTRKLISKQTVWIAKSNPKALQDGYVHDIFSTDNHNLELRLASTTCQNTRVFLRMYGKPMIWFEKNENVDGHFELCAIFTDSNGKQIAYINRNQFIAFTENFDIVSESTSLTIRADNKILLKIDRNANNCFNIKKINLTYLDKSVVIDQQDNIVVSQGGKPSFTMGNTSVKIIDAIGNNTATCLAFGRPLGDVKNQKPLEIAWASNSKISTPIYCSKGQLQGWKLQNEIYSLEYKFVGYCKKNEVFNIVDEFIGYLDGNSIVFPEDSYETGEPIYLSDQNKAFRILNKTGYFDVSFRLFATSY